MVGIFGPLEFLLICIAGWMNQQDRWSNEYLREENRILREQLGKKRIRLTDDQRRRLAVIGRRIGRKQLACASRGGLMPYCCRERVGSLS